MGEGGEAEEVGFELGGWGGVMDDFSNIIYLPQR